MIEKNDRTLSIVLSGPADVRAAMDLSNFLQANLRLEHSQATPPPEPGRIYASLQQVIVVLSPIALYAAKKGIDICAEQVKKWLDGRHEQIEIRIFGPDGQVVKTIKKDVVKKQP